MTVSKAIIVGGGRSRRMNGIDKIFTEIAGKPVILHTMDAFENSPLIDGIVLVLSEENLWKSEELLKRCNYKKIISICAGGEERQDSVGEGVKRIGECDFILVHDCGRPCVTAATIELGIQEAGREGIAVAGSPVTDTIKQVDATEHVEQTFDRSKLRAMHTPQVFRAEILKEMHQNPTIKATDDAALAESMGYKVKIYRDSAENIKITTPEDIAAVENILSRRARAKS